MSKDLKRKSDQLDDLGEEFRTKEKKSGGDEFDPSQFESVESDDLDENDAQEDVPTTSKKTNESDYIKKIKTIITTNFDQEISYKLYELEKIDERIYEVQNMLDKLRVCIICNYYSQNGRLNPSEYMNHPEICNLKCEHLDTVISDVLAHSQPKNVNLERQISANNMATSNYLKLLNDENDLEQKDLSENESIEKFMLKEDLSQSDYLSQLSKQFNIKICVGNVSKYLNNTNNKQSQEVSTSGAGSLINQKSNQNLFMNEDDVTKASIESSQYNQELITHKWMIYIRSPNCHKLENYIKKVVFYLHFSYKPYDMIEIKSPPFQLIKRGWGEFPVRVQIHFKDPRNKRVDINHQLKLDWTQTGLQTFGGESFKDTDLVIKPNDFKKDQKTTSSQSQKPSKLDSDTDQKINLYEKRVQLKENTVESIEESSATVQKQEGPIQIKHLNVSSSRTQASPQLNPMLNINTSDFTSQEMSPSSFISTDIESCSLSTGSNNNSNFATSASFDELMQNFCSNDLNENNTSKIIINETSQSKPITSFESIKIENENMTKKEVKNTVSSSSPSLDELLNLRPKSFSSSNVPPVSNLKSIPIINNSKLAISKVVKSFNTAPISLASMQQNKVLNLSLIAQKDDLIKKLTSVQHNQQQETKQTSLPVKMISFQNISSPKVNPVPNNQSTELIKNSPLSKLNSIVLSASKANNVIYKVSKVDVNEVNNFSEKINLNSDLSNSSPSLHNETSNTIKNLATNQDLIKLNKSNSQQNINCKTDSIKIEDSQIKTKTESEELSNNQIEMDLKESNLYEENSNSNIYSINYLIDQLDKTKNRLLDLNFEAFLRTALKFYPIVSSLSSLAHDQSKTRFFRPSSFCASSIHEFYSWPYGKRKAMEWMRALHVKRKCEELIKSVQNDSNEKSIEIWSTKSVLLWLRSHGFTPLEYQHMASENDSEKNEKSSLTMSYVNSLTPFNKILTHNNYLKMFDKKSESREQTDKDDSLIIDVVNESDQIENSALRCSKISNQNVEYLLNENTSNYIEMCEGSRYVKEQLNLLNIKSQPVEFVSNNDFSEKQNTYTCNLVEKMIYAMAKRFADDLIRQTCSDFYFDPSPKMFSPEEMTTKKQQKIEAVKKNTNDADTLQFQKFPHSLGVSNIYNTIIKHDRFDFLANTYMASPAEPLNDHKKDKRLVNDSSSDVNTNNKKELFKNKDFMDDTNKNLQKINANIKRNFSESSLYKSERC